MADATPNPPSAAISSGIVGRTAPDRGGRSNGGQPHYVPGSWIWLKIRRAFSRESLYSAFKTLLWAGPLTVLIWIYAERNGIDPPKAYNLVIGLRNSDPEHRVLKLESPPDGSIMVDLAGPRAELEKLQKVLSSATEPLVRVDVDPALSPGTHAISLAEISNDPLFVLHGISVTNPEPSAITVSVDQLQHEDWDVQALPSANLASPPAFDPRKVHVRIPQSLLSIPGAKYAAVAELDAIPDIKTPGTHDLSSVPVAVYRVDAGAGPVPTLVTDSAVTVNPGFVAAKVEVKNSDETYDLPSVPVFTTISPIMSEKFQVKIGDPAPTGVLTRVKVVGPPDQIEKLKQPDYLPRPYAEFEVNPSNQLPETPYSSPLRIEGLPDGVHVSADDQNRSITYTLSARLPGG